MTTETAYRMLLENGSIYYGTVSGLENPTLDHILKKDPKTDKYTHYINRIYWAFTNTTEVKEIKILLLVTEDRECWNKKHIEYLERNVHNTFSKKLGQMYINKLKPSNHD